MPRALTLADGQLGATAAVILSGADVSEGRVSVTLHNTGSSDQTVTLTFRRTSSGTARRIARAKLAVDESLIVNGVPIQPDDALLGVASSAAAVDYTVSVCPGDEPLSMQTFDETGSARSVNTGDSVIEVLNGRLSALVHDEEQRRLLEEVLAEIRDARKEQKERG